MTIEKSRVHASGKRLEKGRKRWGWKLAARVEGRGGIVKYLWPVWANPGLASYWRAKGVAHVCTFPYRQFAEVLQHV